MFNRYFFIGLSWPLVFTALAVTNLVSEKGRVEYALILLALSLSIHFWCGYWFDKANKESK